MILPWRSHREYIAVDGILRPSKTIYILSVWGQEIYFSLFSFYALFAMLLKGMGERFLLSKDEPLTPSIDGVMAL